MCLGEPELMWNVSGWRRALTAMSFCRFPNNNKQYLDMKHAGRVGGGGYRRGVVAMVMHSIHTDYFSIRQPQSTREGRTGEEEGTQGFRATERDLQRGTTERKGMEGRRRNSFRLCHSSPPYLVVFLSYSIELAFFATIDGLFPIDTLTHTHKQIFRSILVFEKECYGNFVALSFSRLLPCIQLTF